MYSINGINNIPFRGNGETAGSVSYLSNSFAPNRLADDNNGTAVNYRGKASETTGSVAYQLGEDTKGDIVEISGKGETTGSVGYQLNDESNMNFKGYDDYDKNKSTPWGGIILGSVALAAVVIGGLGYAHKANILGKMNDGFMKKTLTKCEPAMKKCHEWCASTKKLGVKTWETISGWFHKK